MEDMSLSTLNVIRSICEDLSSCVSCFALPVVHFCADLHRLVVKAVSCALRYSEIGKFHPVFSLSFVWLELAKCHPPVL